MKSNDGWTSRKRVFAALEHKEPDRIPINFGGCAQTTILECPPDAKACTQLYEHLRIENYEEPVTGALANQVYNLDERVMNRFGNDFRLILLAKDMEPWRLKKEFGKDLTFFGGVDTQQLLYKSPEEVRQGVKELIQHYAPGGGYIFGTGHNIEPDTPLENIPAMFEAALEYGQYPLTISY